MKNIKLNKKIDREKSPSILDLIQFDVPST